MKKLFFTALVAIVALGGAYAQYYPIGSSTLTYFCPEGLVTCHIKYGDDPLVSLDPPPIQQQRERLSSIPWDGLN